MTQTEFLNRNILYVDRIFVKLNKKSLRSTAIIFRMHTRTTEHNPNIPTIDVQRFLSFLLKLIRGALDFIFTTNIQSSWCVEEESREKSTAELKKFLAL